jgi:hypothetical protein
MHHLFSEISKSWEPGRARYACATKENHVSIVAVFEKLFWNTWAVGEKSHMSPSYLPAKNYICEHPQRFCAAVQRMGIGLAAEAPKNKNSRVFRPGHPKLSIANSA